MRGLVSGFVVLACIAAPVIAQRTWIVDAANGPGTHFTDLPSAVAIAAPGDRILVRPAAAPYSAVTLTRGVSLFGFVGRATCEGITVRDVPPSETVVLADLHLNGWNAERVAGPLLLESVTASTGNSIASRARIVDCPWVSFRGGGVTADSFLHVQRSFVFFEMAMLGSGAGTQSGVGGLILVEDSVVVANATVLRGQTGTFFGPWFGASCYLPIPAIEVVRSLLVVTGNSRITGGRNPSGGGCPSIPYGCPAPSLRSVLSTVVLDPSTVVECPAVQPVHSLAVPRVATGAIAIGSSITAHCEAPPGAAVFVLGSVTPLQPTTLPGGLAWLDSATLAVVFAGLVPPQGSFTQQIAVPVAVPMGTAFAFQAAIATANGFTLSAPSFPIAWR